MLHEFVTANRDAIIAGCRARIATRPVPRPTDVELEYGVPRFLDQLTDSLRAALNADLVPNTEIAASAAKHGNEMLHSGFTVGQVVRDYGGICQTITQLAIEMSAPITAQEFQTLNLCLDDAIAGAVTEYGRLRAREDVVRTGHRAHEMRNLLNSAFLAVGALREGTVGLSGSTGAILTRSLQGLRDLIDRELADVRLGADVHHREAIIVREFIEDVEIAATMDASAHDLQFSVDSATKDTTVLADRQILASVVANLLQNAFKFTRPGGLVTLRAHATADRVLIDVEDQCGGLPPGKAEELFRPFEQRGRDRTGLGLGLAISRRGAQANDGEIRVLNQPGTGCVFTVDLPRQIRVPSP